MFISCSDEKASTPDSTPDNVQDTSAAEKAAWEEYPDVPFATVMREIKEQAMDGATEIKKYEITVLPGWVDSKLLSDSDLSENCEAYSFKMEAEAEFEDESLSIVSYVYFELNKDTGLLSLKGYLGGANYDDPFEEVADEAYDDIISMVEMHKEKNGGQTEPEPEPEPEPEEVDPYSADAAKEYLSEHLNINKYGWGISFGFDFSYAIYEDYYTDPGLDFSITLDGTKFNIPFTYSTLKNNGWTAPAGEDTVIDEPTYGDFTSPKGNKARFSLTCGDSEKPLKDCTFYQANPIMWNSNGYESKVSFNCMGVTNTSSLDDIFDTLGLPAFIKYTSNGKYFEIQYQSTNDSEEGFLNIVYSFERDAVQSLVLYNEK